MVKTNESLTMDGAILADWHTRETEKNGIPPFRRKRIFDLAGPKFTLPESAIQKIMETSDDEVTWIAQEFGLHLQQEVSNASFYTELKYATYDGLAIPKAPVEDLPAKEPSIVPEPREEKPGRVSNIFRNYGFLRRR
jgi:hypothetical protein